MNYLAKIWREERGKGGEVLNGKGCGTGFFAGISNTEGIKGGSTKVQDTETGSVGASTVV